MHVATLADSWAGIIYTGTWYITYCGMLWSSSGEHCGSARGHQQHKIWISSDGTLSPPLRRTFVFLSRVHCGGLEVGGGGRRWRMAEQSAHRQLLPYSPTPSYIPHCTTDNSFYRSSKYAKAAPSSSGQYSPSPPPTPQQSASNYCLAALLTLLSYSCTFLMDHLTAQGISWSILIKHYLSSPLAISFKVDKNGWFKN